MIKHILQILRTRGLPGLAGAVHRRLLRPRVAHFGSFVGYFRNKVGLEIGGPSDVFRRHNLFPVYTIAARVDNCNFERTTTWEGEICEGDTFVFDETHTTGRQFIAEATDLDFIADASYDFVLSSHALEHVANPLKALAEWKRVLKDGGLLVLVLPDHVHTFDHHRPITTLQHLVDDQAQDIGENDLTHLDEILSLHDFARDPEADGRAAFIERAQRNAEHRCLHHHVFDPKLAIAVVEHAQFQVQSSQSCDPFHIFVVARKSAKSGEITLSGTERTVRAH